MINHEYEICKIWQNRSETIMKQLSTYWYTVADEEADTGFYNYLYSDIDQLIGIYNEIHKTNVKRSDLEHYLVIV